MDNSRNFTVITPPPVEPVTLQELYDWLRLDPLGSPPTHPHDDMLRGLISSARQQVEDYCKRALVQQTLQLVLPNFPNSYVLFSNYRAFTNSDDFEQRPHFIELLSPPLIEVQTVEYYDESNTLRVLPPAQWFVSENTLPARLNIADGYIWPTTYSRSDAVRVTYVAGYPPLGSPGDGPDLAANVPESFKQAIKVRVQLAYDELAVDKRNALEAFYKNLLVSFIVKSF